MKVKDIMSSISKSPIPNFDFLKEKNIEDLMLYFESYHMAQETVSKKRHRTIVFITICSLCLTLVGLLYQNHIHLNNQSDIQEINRQQIAIDKERNELLKQNQLLLEHLKNEQVTLDSLNKKY